MKKSNVESKMLRGEKRHNPLAKFPTPPNTTWNMVSIQFVSEDSVKVSVKSIHRGYTFADMGFKDNRKYNSPNTQWEILRFLAKNKGELSWQKGTAIYSKKEISRVRKRLRTFMGIDDDPFFRYRNIWCYRTKFRIGEKTDAFSSC